MGKANISRLGLCLSDCHYILNEPIEGVCMLRQDSWLIKQTEYSINKYIQLGHLYLCLSMEGESGKTKVYLPEKKTVNVILGLLHTGACAT